MPSAYKWHLRAADGTTIKRETRITDALANGVPPGATLKRERIHFSRGPQAKRPKVREDQPPVVPARRAPDPAPLPGERIDANGNAIRD
jgi:hypothetical protein